MTKFLPLQIPYNLSQLNLSVNPVTPMVVIVPTPFPYNDTRAIPWIYDTPIYIHGQKVQEEPIKSNDPLISTTETSGVTRSGRIFAPSPSLIENSRPSVHNKGKQVDNTSPRKDPLTTSKVDEFLRIIKRSDY